MAQQKLSIGQAIDQVIGALEGLEPDARRTVVETACAHLKIIVGHSASGRAPEVTIPAKKEEGADRVRVSPPTPSPPSRPAADIRSLKSEKMPKSAREMACVVAFFLQELAPESERKDAVTSADLEKYFKQAGFELPEKIGQVLVDAKGSGYFDSATRGAYKLNAVGYNLVAHRLPTRPAGS